MERKLVAWVAVVVLVLFAAILVQGFLQLDQIPSADSAPAAREGFLDPIWEAYQRTQDHFYRPERVQGEQLRDEAIRGMVEALGDPYSRYNTKQEFQRFSEGLEGEYEGIGAWIGMRDGAVTIISPIKGGPAKRSGVRAGDVVLEIDGESAEGLSISEAAQKLRGPQGTEVAVKVQHTDGSVEEVTIVRARIEVPSVEWMRPTPAVGYVAINRFASSTPQELERALGTLRQEAGSLEGLILDLRGNGGGYLAAAEQVASAFVDQGDPLLVVQGRDGQREVDRSSGNDVPNWPIAVLVDGGTASGAEIVAGAIRDNGMGVLVGRRTFGKGVVQTPFRLSDGSMLILTTAEYFTPRGDPVHEVGLPPDPRFAVKDWFPTFLEVRHEIQALESSLPRFAEASRQVLEEFDRGLSELEQRAVEDEYEEALHLLGELGRRLRAAPEALLGEAGASPDDPELALITPLLEELQSALEPLLVELQARLQENDIAVALDWLRSDEVRGRSCPCEFAPGMPSTD